MSEIATLQSMGFSVWTEHDVIQGHHPNGLSARLQKRDNGTWDGTYFKAFGLGLHEYEAGGCSRKESSKAALDRIIEQMEEVGLLPIKA